MPLVAGASPEAVLDQISPETKAITLDVGSGVDGETATRIAEISAKKKLSITVRGDDRRALREYAHVPEEVPPSMIWVRIAIRAAQASRGEQRLLRLRRKDPTPPAPMTAQDEANPGHPRRQG